MNRDPSSTAQFEEILIAAKERRGDLPIDTMIVASHLAQMRTFILRRGLEFLCDQDSYGKRKEFLAQLYQENMLEMKLDSIIDYFLCDGQGLFYFRPNGESYQILYFAKNQYRCYRNQRNEIDYVELIYDFAVKSSNTLMDTAMQLPNQRGKKKYIRLKVYKDKIEQTVADEELHFEDEAGGMPQIMGGRTETLTNTLGFVPAVEVFNYLDCTGEAYGRGEFDWLSNQIMGHNDLIRNIRKNLTFFGNPTLVSSRPKHDIVESGDESTFRPTISSQAGFAAANRPSTKSIAPFGPASPMDGQIKVPRVIANLEPTDRVNYLTPDSVSGDQNLYAKQYRSEIRLALGGVDDIDIGTAGTAYEIKTLYGRVAATAEKKARSLFTFGLCPLMAMMVKHEEYLFNQSFDIAMGLDKPPIPLQEEFPEDPDAYTKAMADYQKKQQKYLEKRDKLFRATLEAGTIPPGVTGLIPDGSPKVSWRWMGDVFEESADDILQHSIVVRNLQELGVDSVEALKYLFPQKTDDERAAMLTGFPFRVVQQTQSSINSFIGLLGQLYQLPHPQTPNLPLASDPNLDITGFLYRSLDFLRKELSYSGRYNPSSDDTTPGELSDADRRRASLGLPIRDERPINLAGVTDDGTNSGSGLGESGTPGLQPGTGPAGFGSGPIGGESMAGSVPGSFRQPEYVIPLPDPGSVLSTGDADTSSKYPNAMGFTAVSGAADLQSPSFNPNLFGTPTGSSPAANAGSPVRPTGRSTKRKRS